MRSLLTLAVICNISHTILAFPFIQQQLLLSKGGSLPVSTTTSNNIRNELSSKGQRCHHREPQSIVVRSTLRAGGGNSASQKINDTSMLGRYSQFVDEKPLLAKSMTAGIVTALANIFSQIVVASQAQSALIVSWSRVVVYMLTGMCFIGPYLHFWYGFLDRVLVLPKQKPTTRLAIKVVVDQLVGVCIFYPPYFMFMEIAEATLLGRGMYKSKGWKCPSCMMFQLLTVKPIVYFLLFRSSYATGYTSKVPNGFTWNCFDELARMANHQCHQLWYHSTTIPCLSESDRFFLLVRVPIHSCINSMS